MPHTGGVNPLDRAFENCERKWIEPAQLDRFTLSLDVGVEGSLDPRGLLWTLGLPRDGEGAVGINVGISGV